MAFCQVGSILFIKLWQYIVFLSLLLSGIKNTLALVNYLQSEIHFIFFLHTLYFLVTFSSLLAFTAPFIPNILLQNRDIWLLARAYLHVLYPFHVSSFALQRKEVYLQNNLPQDLGYENQIVVQVNGINVLNTQKKRNKLILLYISILSIGKCKFVAKQRKLEQIIFPLKRPISNVINVK